MEVIMIYTGEEKMNLKRLKDIKKDRKISTSDFKEARIEIVK
jgi:hypothetical protein